MARKAGNATAVWPLSNGSYRVLVTGSGGGVSACGDLQLTAPRGELAEAPGLSAYCRDLDSGAWWTVNPAPASEGPARCRIADRVGAVRVFRRGHGLEVRLDVCVASEIDAEIRLLRVRNLSPRARRLDITTYAELALAPPAAHAAHPAFSKLFVQTEYATAERVLLARRRSRSAEEPEAWAFHIVLPAGTLEFETDRAVFMGRGRDLDCPLAMDPDGGLSGTTGNVLDPILSLRRRLRLRAGETRILAVCLGFARSRAAALAAARKLQRWQFLQAAFAAAQRRERALRSALRMSSHQARRWVALAGAIFSRRASPAPGAIARCRGRTLEELTAYGIAPELPLVAVRARAPQVLRDAVRAHAWWRANGLDVQLAVLCETPAQCAAAARLLAAAGDPQNGSRAQRIFLCNRQELGTRALELVEAAAWAILPRPRRSARPRIARQQRPLAAPARTGSPPSSVRAQSAPEVSSAPRPAGEFDNGYGYFLPAEREYAIRVQPGTRGHFLLPPAPWINVVANERFGFVASETGAGFTWSENSRENRLTPWSNDPLCDPHEEALYVRDEDARVFWSPLPGPVPAPAPYEVRHGHGYSRWVHASFELEQQVTLFVPRGERSKILWLHLRNTAAQMRHLSVFAYCRLALGSAPSPSVRARVDAKARAVLAENPLRRHALGRRIAFLAPLRGDGSRAAFAADRRSFLGPRLSPAEPAALRTAQLLDGRPGEGTDTCAAAQIRLRLRRGETADCAFLFGEARSRAEAVRIVRRYQAKGRQLGEHCARRLAAVRRFWRTLTTAIQAETPARAIDLVLDGWLLYQTTSCRLWGRSAFYQSGGAFGFRDQLQDAAALVYSRPDLTRAQILLHAAHQFVEGDVLHWWHPPFDCGTRTRFSDDLLWLPYIAVFYAETTGDWAVFDEPARFLVARELAPGEDEAYLQPRDSGQRADLYAHCCRAIDRSLRVGQHGLPLMGTGDWNDGMNRVGRRGAGESVWLGFFLCAVLEGFAAVCRRRGDAERARRYAAHRQRLRAALEEAGWDGQWYRRAYYDDGTPLGSAQNDECRIDALVQAWAVISRVADRNRAAQAMEAVHRLLVVEDLGLVRLLWPPFDRSPQDPGYIKGYVPGIRENGGQYTHAALWVVRAFAEIGERDRAAALLESLSPAARAGGPAAVERYRVEPYAVAADVYTTPPHAGRGGWTWYTGSAAWMYRVALESILGFRITGGHTLHLEPRIPDHWPGYHLRYRLPDGKTIYDIEVRNPSGCAARISKAILDGARAKTDGTRAIVPLLADEREHRVALELGELP